MYKLSPFFALLLCWFMMSASADGITRIGRPLSELDVIAQPNGFSAIEVARPSFELAKPDLVAWSLDVDNNSYIVFKIRNFGGPFLPSNTASYRIYVDGRLAEERILSQITNQDFRKKMGYTRSKSSVRIGGTNRRVALIVDPNNDIGEVRKDQNSVYATLSSPIISSVADLAITDLAVGSRRSSKTLQVTPTNKGGIKSKYDLQFIFSVSINEAPPKLIPMAVPATDPGQTTVINLSNAGDFRKRAMVDVTMTPSRRARATDFDLTNNSRSEEIPFNMKDYNAILQNPKIAHSIIWNEGAIKVSYPGWTDAQKQQLADSIQRRENGDLPLINGPPSVLSLEGSETSTISRDDAWKIFLSFVAQSLWVEKNRIVPWSLADLNESELLLLFDASKIFWPSDRYALSNWQFPANEVSFYTKLHGGSLGNITAWNPAIGYDFLTNSGMLKQSQEETLYALTSWMQARLNHTQPWHGDREGPFRGPVDREAEWGYTGNPLVDTILYPLPKRSHRLHGCGSNTGLYSYLLRAVNIPVEKAAIGITIPSQSGVIPQGGHSHNRPIFPTIGKTMVHADDPYTWWFTPSINPMPPNEIFHDFPQVSEQDEKIWGPFYPQLDLVPGSHIVTSEGLCQLDGCSEKFAQATYLYRQDAILKSYQYKSGFLLKTYMKYGPSGVRSVLTGPYENPYFTEIAQDLMISAIELRLRGMGNGDLNKGLELLAYRSDLFSQTQDTAAYVRSQGSEIDVMAVFYQDGNASYQYLLGMEVDLYEVGEDGVFGNGDDTKIGHAVSNEAGQFRFTGLEEGIYVLDIIDETIPPNCQLDTTKFFASDPSYPIPVELGETYGGVGWVFNGDCQ